LKKRVTDTAKTLCDELDRFYGKSTKEDSASCLKHATAGGMKQADAVISGKSAMRSAEAPK
jgi:hypothetical protein